MHEYVCTCISITMEYTYRVCVSVRKLNVAKERGSKREREPREKKARYSKTFVFFQRGEKGVRVPFRF